MVHYLLDSVKLLVQIVQAEHTLQINRRLKHFIVGALGTGSSFSVGDRALLVIRIAGPNIKCKCFQSNG